MFGSVMLGLLALCSLMGLWSVLVGLLPVRGWTAWAIAATPPAGLCVTAAYSYAWQLGLPDPPPTRLLVAEAAPPHPIELIQSTAVALGVIVVISGLGVLLGRMMLRIGRFIFNKFIEP